MSDVPARCSRCGNEIRVSEFIALESLKCPNCKSQLILDKSTVERGANRLAVRKEKPPEPAAAPESNPTTSNGVSSLRRKRRPESKIRQIGKIGVSDYVISWFIFLTLTPVLCLLRYVDFLAESDVLDLIYGGQIAFAIFYLVILVEAFSDDIFDGILCLFLAPYTFYYLFVKSTSFVLRAILLALFAAFGYDICLTVYAWIIWAIDYVTWWINTGALNG